MIVRYNRNRTFRIWEVNGIWYGVEAKYIVNGQLAVSYKDCLHAGSRDDMIDIIEARCRFEELVDNGMDRAEAAKIALFGE